MHMARLFCCVHAELQSTFALPTFGSPFPTLRGKMSVETNGGHPAMDYPEHLRTYQGFLRGSLVLIVLVAILLLGMLIMLV